MRRVRKPLIIASVLSLLAFSGAFGVNTVLAWLIAVPEGSVVGNMLASASDLPSEDGRGEAAPKRRSKREYVDGILKRNIFDSAFVDAYNPAATSTADGSVAVTEMKVKLLATLVAEPESYSSALIIEDDPNAQPQGYAIGDKLQGAEIVAIEPTQIKLKRPDGQIEILSMADEAPVASRRGSSGSGDGSVENRGDGKYAIDRSLLDKYTSDMGALSQMGRALLHRGADGQFDGYRLSAIRRDTLPDKLGIRNGDIIHSVNGMALSSVQGAMSAWGALQNENTFTIDITRRGQRKTMEYDIR